MDVSAVFRLPLGTRQELQLLSLEGQHIAQRIESNSGYSEREES